MKKPKRPGEPTQTRSYFSSWSLSSFSLRSSETFFFCQTPVNEGGASSDEPCLLVFGFSPFSSPQEIGCWRWLISWLGFCFFVFWKWMWFMKRNKKKYCSLICVGVLYRSKGLFSFFVASFVVLRRSYWEKKTRKIFSCLVKWHLSTNIPSFLPSVLPSWLKRQGKSLQYTVVCGSFHRMSRADRDEAASDSSSSTVLPFPLVIWSVTKSSPQPATATRTKPRV